MRKGTVTFCAEAVVEKIKRQRREGAALFFGELIKLEVKSQNAEVKPRARVENASAT
ncbi:MAG: hypothetical protein ABR921_09430 [Candidatus Sulfotelmatobacter sp.]|jgi:hypothetical protein